MSRQAITISQVNGVTNVIADSHISYQNQINLAKSITNVISTGGSMGASGSGASITISVWENFSTKNYYTKPGSGIVSRPNNINAVSYGPPTPPVSTSLNAVASVTATGTSTASGARYLGGTVNFSSAVTVTSLGRYAVSGNSHKHIIKLVLASTGVDVPGSSTTVDMAGSSANTFVYASLSAPLFVPAGLYFLVSDETVSGDNHYDYAGTTVTYNGSMVFTGGVYSNGVNTYVQQSSNGHMYGPLDIVYKSVNVAYLSAAGSLGTGDGSYSANAMDASTQDKLDAIYKSYILPSGALTFGVTTYFYYAPGTYQTLGRLYQSRYTINSGNYHIGSGIDKTIIKLVGASNLTNDGQIFSRDTYGTSILKNWGCWDMTLDCNGANNPKTMNGGAGGTVSAINLPAGQNITIQRVKVIHWGAVTVGHECFPIAIAGQSTQVGAAINNVLIDSCIITSPMSGNADGASCMIIADSPNINPPCTVDQTCIISNCQILDVFPNTGFGYVHSYGAPVCVNNFTRNGDVAYFGEPAYANEFSSVGTVIIKNNIAIGVNRGVYVLFHNSSSFPNVEISDEFYQLNGTNSVGIQLTGQGTASPKGTTGNVLVSRNTILTPYGTNAIGIKFNEGASSQDMTYAGLILNANILQGFSSLANAVSLDSHIGVLPIVLRLNNDWVL